MIDEKSVDEIICMKKSLDALRKFQKQAMKGNGVHLFSRKVYHPSMIVAFVAKDQLAEYDEGGLGASERLTERIMQAITDEIDELMREIAQRIREDNDGT